MPKNLEGDDKRLIFTESEQRELQQIVIDWINERLAVTPHSREVQSIVRKLNINVEVSVEPDDPTLRPNLG
jgi:hypothetical protein